MNREEAKEIVRNVDYDDLTIDQLVELGENEIFPANDTYYFDGKLGKDIPLQINKYCPYDADTCLNAECKCMNNEIRSAFTP